MYDYLIVGAGLYGATFAHEMTKRGKKCLVIEKRKHVAGNVYTESIEGIQVHTYGAHIFHTSNKEVWNYVNQFAAFNNYINSPIANYHGEIYNLPFNMNTFYQMWKEADPQKVAEIIKEQRKEIVNEPKNLEEQAIQLVGRDIYERLIKGYTMKQWGRACTQLPPFIIKRLPVRMTYDNNYFYDAYQGIPIGGYTQIIEKMLEGSDIRLATDYFDDRQYWDGQAEKILYTGQVDTFFDYKYGPLEYRSLRFETEALECDNYQGNAVVNYTDELTPYTRIIEHKHFEFKKDGKTVITREYSEDYTPGKEAYYPINDQANTMRYEQYKQLAERQEHVLFGGRLGEYRYINMDKTIELALERVKREVGLWNNL